MRDKVRIEQELNNRQAFLSFAAGRSERGRQNSTGLICVIYIIEY